MNPVLVPAFPAVLRAGLPVVVNGVSCVFLGHADGSVVVIDATYPEDGCEYNDSRVAVVRLDLRDPTVRDAVVRAIWRKLRPTEPEPLTAPMWRFGRHQHRGWSIETDGMILIVDAKDYPGLDSVSVFAAPTPFDRDLLALAAVACAVLA